MIIRIEKAGGFRETANHLSADRARAAWEERRGLMTQEYMGLVMEDLAAMNTRVKGPGKHIIVSWHPSDDPTEEEQREVAGRLLTTLGVTEEQAYIVAHNDRGHALVQILLNRVHPATKRALWDSYWHYKTEELRARDGEGVRVGGG